MPILFVHVPKAAGTSFGKWLGSALGPDRIAGDFSDRPLDPTSEMNVDPEGFLFRRRVRRLPDWIAGIRRHFWIKKYDGLIEARRITFLRNPVERAVSHYYYWREQPDRGHTLHRAILNGELSLFDFARLPQIAGCYRNHFFREVDMASFEFIGDQGRYDAEVDRAEKLLGLRGERIVANRNENSTYLEMRGDTLQPGPTRAELESVLAPEIAFYERYAGH